MYHEHIPYSPLLLSKFSVVLTLVRQLGQWVLFVLLV